MRGVRQVRTKSVEQVIAIWADQVDQIDKRFVSLYRNYYPSLSLLQFPMR